MHLPLFITLSAIWLFVLWRLVFKLEIATKYKILFALVLFPLANYLQIAAYFSGAIASVELPHWAMLALAFGFGFFLLLAILALVRDLIALAFRLPLPKVSKKILSSNKPNILILLLAFSLSIYGVWQGVKIPNVKTIALQLKDLPPEFNGYRIVQISDTHASQLLPEQWQAAVVAKANALKPNLIVITGDLADGTVAARAKDIAPLANLKAKDGVLAVPGNHEYYTDYIDWIKALRGLGLTVLENQAVEIQHKGASLIFAGLTDRQANEFALTPPDLEFALKDTVDAPVVVLQHRPDEARSHAANGVMLLLAGHTHGGQIIGVNLLTKLANNGFLSGIYNLGDMKAYVSNGTGLWHGLGLRLGVESEITQIILKTKD